MQPSVTIIIVSWNALPLLKKCFPSVAASSYPRLEVVVADNASTDGSSDWLGTHFPGVRVIRHPDNWRFARGNNEAISLTQSDYVVLLNNDVEVPPGWLDPLVAEMERDPSIAAVQPKLLQFEARNRFEYAGASGGFVDLFGYPFARGRLFETLEPDLGQYDDARDVFWASGAAMMLRRSALDRVGLLDERFEMHMEEIDLCWRLHRNGFRVRVVPETPVYHVGGGSLPKGSPKKTYYNFRNSLLMLYKNLPPRLWSRILPQRSALDFAAAARAMASGRGNEAMGILRAYRDAHRMRSAYAGCTASPGESLPAHVYRGSIALEYFVRGRRTFADLAEARFTQATERP